MFSTGRIFAGTGRIIARNREDFARNREGFGGNFRGRSHETRRPLEGRQSAFPGVSVVDLLRATSSRNRCRRSRRGCPRSCRDRRAASATTGARLALEGRPHLRPEIFRLAKVDRTTQGVLQQEAGNLPCGSAKTSGRVRFRRRCPHRCLAGHRRRCYRTEHGKVTDAAPPQFRFRGSQSTPHFVKHSPSRHEVRPAIFARGFQDNVIRPGNPSAAAHNRAKCLKANWRA